MKAIKIKIAGTEFLLPESDSYEFPAYILANKPLIAAHVAAGKKWLTDSMTDYFSDLPDATDFKSVTGIIGFPFDARDPNLYAIERGIEIALEIEL